MTNIVGISRSLIWVKSNKFRFKFSTSVTTIATSGNNLSFLFSSNSITTFSSIDILSKIFSNFTPKGQYKVFERSREEAFKIPFK